MDTIPCSVTTIKGSLKGSGLHAELPLAHCREMVALAREDAAKIIAQGRREAVIAARRIRQQARANGYQAGLRAGRREIERILEGLHSTYSSCSEAAQEDALTLAYQLAEEVIQDTFINHPQSFRLLLERAFEILKHSREMTLSYHPRYEQSITAIVPTFRSGITLRAHDDPSGADFVLTSEDGAVESAWREALGERVAAYSSQRPKVRAQGRTR